jgi:uncharacterized protein (TIGR02246 family)
MMRWILSLVVTALLVLSADAARAQAADGVKGLDEAWTAAAKKGDAEAIVALYAADATYYALDAFEARGTAAIRKSYADWFGAVTVTDAKFDSAYTTSGDLSIGYGTATVTMQPKGGGAAQTVTVRVTEVAKKVGGKWKYLVDHASAPMPPPPPSK